MQVSGFLSALGVTLFFPTGWSWHLLCSLPPAPCPSIAVLIGSLLGCSRPVPPPPGPWVSREPMFILPWVAQTSVCRLPVSSCKFSLLLSLPLWRTMSSCSLSAFPNHCYRTGKEEPPIASGHQPDSLSAALPLSSHSVATSLFLYPSKAPLSGAVQLGPDHITFSLAYMPFI